MLSLVLMTPFAITLVGYGGWTLFTAATQRTLDLGEIQLGALALLTGSLLLVCLIAMAAHRAFLPKDARQHPPSTSH